MYGPYVMYSARKMIEKARRERREASRAERASQLETLREERAATSHERRSLPHAGVMPLSSIARELGVSERTVAEDYTSAIDKLKRERGAFEVMLAWIQACAEARQPLIRCASVECRAEWIQKFGLD